MEFSKEFYELRRQMRRWDNYSILDYAKKEGREEGREKGRQEGALAEKKQAALQMRKDGLSNSAIAKYTKLSKEQIEAL